MIKYWDPKFEIYFGLDSHGIVVPGCNNEINPCHDLYEFKHNDNTYYFFEQNVRKHLVYNTDMIPNLSSTHTLFITNLLIA